MQQHDANIGITRERLFHLIDVCILSVPLQVLWAHGEAIGVSVPPPNAPVRNVLVAGNAATSNSVLLKLVPPTNFGFSSMLITVKKISSTVSHHTDPASVIKQQFEHFGTKSNSSQQKCGDLGSALPKFGPPVSRPGSRSPRSR